MESQHAQFIREEDLDSVPMSQEHRIRIARHIVRLQRTINNSPRWTKIPGYTSRSAAREQLAYMTVIFRDYMSGSGQGKAEDAAPMYESMVADLIDASFYISDDALAGARIACTNSVFFGREQEMERLMQETLFESVDVVEEMYGAVGSNENDEYTDNPGKDLDLNTLLRHYHSEDNMVHNFKKNLPPEVRNEWARADYYPQAWEKWQLENTTWPPLDESIRMTPIITSSIGSTEVVDSALPSNLALESN